MKRVRLVGGEPRSLFRRLDEDGGLNSLDLVLTLGEGEPVRIADASVALSGEFLSRTMAGVLARGSGGT